MNETPPDGDRAVGDISRLSKILGNVVAPTTVLTALLFYFGWAHAYWFFNYLGVNSTLLGLSTPDYLMRSLDGLFVPVTIMAAIALSVLWIGVLWKSHLPSSARARLNQLGAWAVPIVGVVLTVYGMSRLFWEGRLNNALGVAPVSLSTGVLLLVWVVHRRRKRTSAGGEAIDRMPWVSLLEWAAVFMLVGLCLFWAATDYSAAVGTARARELIEQLSAEPSVVLYSERSLSLHAPGVREVQCADQGAAYRFRYDGLKLIWHSDNQYVLLPAAWESSSGVAIVMPRQDTLRLEFAQASVVPSLTC